MSSGTPVWDFTLHSGQYRVRVVPTTASWETPGYRAKLISVGGIGTIMEPHGRTPTEALTALVRELLDTESVFERKLAKDIVRHTALPMAHARVIRQAPTGRPVFAEHERASHITTAGRRALTRAQFALPPGPEEKRRGIKGRLPIDDADRARSALGRARQMFKRGHISSRELAAVRRAVHRAWPSIEIEEI